MNHPPARRRLIRGVAAALVAAFAAGVGSSALAQAAGGLTKFNVAMVSSIDTEPYLYAKRQGYYAQAGLDVTLAKADSGPALVTGVLNGTYDGASAAAFPVLIAISKGAPLKILPGATVVGTGHGNSGLVVRADSPIKSYKDLVGKTVATNALTSLTTLATKIGVKKEGGDPNAVKFISLPFKSSVQAVAQGQADAAVVISPFQTEAELSGLKVIADPIGTMMPKGSPYNIMFTNAKNSEAKVKDFAAFNQATLRAVKELAADPALQRRLAVSLVGMTDEVAAKVPLPDYNAAPIDLPSLQKYADFVAEYGYSDKPVDVKRVVVNP